MSDAPRERAPLTENDWDEVLAWLQRAVERRGLAHRFGEGALHVDRGTGWASFPLHDLGEILTHSPRDRWRSMTNHWLRIALTRDDVLDLGDLSQVRDRLRLRLLPDAADTGEAELVALRVMEDVQAVLALDLPDAVLTVSRSQLARWGLEERDAMGMALHHVIAEPAETEQLEGPDGAEVIVRTGDSHFVASQVLALEHWLDNEHGALIAVPNRHTLLYHPIRDGRALQMVQALWLLAAAPFREGPGPISPHVYWWLPGRFARIEIEIDEASDAVALRPPRAFAELMQVLQSHDTPPAEA